MKPQRNAQHISERDSFILKTKEDEIAKILTILNQKNKPYY